MILPLDVVSYCNLIRTNISPPRQKCPLFERFHISTVSVIDQARIEFGLVKRKLKRWQLFQVYVD